MKKLINKIVFGAVILGGLTSCVAYPDAYSNNNQNGYYNAIYNNGNYYAPSSYYGNGGYYANDGYYYRDNMNYQYENNVPYYYGNNQRRIYLEKRSKSQRDQNSVRNDRGNSDGVIIRNNTRGNQSTNDGFRNTPSPSSDQEFKLTLRSESTTAQDLEIHLPHLLFLAFKIIRK
ncbi:hypothetical protein [Halpernia sp. GG3]